MKQNVYSEYYKKNKDYQIELYAYTPPGDGVFVVDGIETHLGQDFRTVEHYQTYKDCGFNTILGQVAAKIDSDDFENSAAKKVMDIAHKIGIKKFILLDDRLRGLSAVKGGVIGEDKEFKSEAELDAYVDSCIKVYEHHPMFSALQLVDEPVHDTLISVGQVFRSIKRVRPNVQVQCNLNPPQIVYASSLLKWYKGGTIWDKYKAYLNDFLDVTGADYFLYDYYPLVNEMDSGIIQSYVRGMQVAAEVAVERGVEFRMVIQTMFYLMNGRQNERYIKKEDVYFQANLCLGYGVKQLACFTYWTKLHFDSKWFASPKDAAIVDRLGNPTSLYYSVQEVNSYIQKLAPVIKDFAYVADAYTITMPCKSRPAHILPLVSKELKNVKSFVNDKEVSLIGEMYDKANDKYMYRLMNVSDPFYGTQTGEQSIEVVFDEKFKFADVFHDGEWKTVELVDGKYETKLLPGFADYVIIY